MLDRLFVYGSLRRAATGIHPLLAPDCRFVSMATCRGVMYDLGPYPAVVPSLRAEDVVVGELYRLDDPQRALRRLDAYEGVRYRRDRRNVTTEHGARTDAWIYLYVGSLEDGTRVPSGDYSIR